MKEKYLPRLMLLQVALGIVRFIEREENRPLRDYAMQTLMTSNANANFDTNFAKKMMSEMDAQIWLSKGELKEIDCKLWEAICVLALWIWSWDLGLDEDDFEDPTYTTNYLNEIVQAYALYIKD